MIFITVVMARSPAQRARTARLVSCQDAARALKTQEDHSTISLSTSSVTGLDQIQLTPLLLLSAPAFTLPESCSLQIQKLEADICDALLVIEGQEVALYESMHAQNSLRKDLDAAVLDASHALEQSTDNLARSQSIVSRIEDSNKMLKRKVSFITLKACVLGSPLAITIFLRSMAQYWYET